MIIEIDINTLSSSLVSRWNKDISINLEIISFAASLRVTCVCSWFCMEIAMLWQHVCVSEWMRVCVRERKKIHSIRIQIAFTVKNSGFIVLNSLNKSLNYYASSCIVKHFRVYVLCVCESQFKAHLILEWTDNVNAKSCNFWNLMYFLVSFLELHRKFVGIFNDAWNAMPFLFLSNIFSLFFFLLVIWN